MQLDEQLGELVLREHGFEKPLQEDIDQAAVQLLVLEHFKDPEDALARGFRPDDVLEFVWGMRGKGQKQNKTVVVRNTTVYTTAM